MVSKQRVCGDNEETYGDTQEGADSEAAVPYSLKVYAKVDGVQFVDGIGFLKVGDTTLPLASVVEIYGSSTS